MDKTRFIIFQQPSSETPYSDDKMKETTLSSNKQVSKISKIDAEDKNRHHKETLQSPDSIVNDLQGNLWILMIFS